VTLTNDNLQAFLDGHEHAVVDFYAPWCEHCKTLEPEFEKAASMLRAEGLATRFAKMDASGNDEHMIEGWPTVKYYHKGKPSHLQKFQVQAASVANLIRRKEFAHLIELKGDIDEFLAGIKKVGTFTLVAYVKRKSARANAYLKAQEELAAWLGTAFRFAVVWLPETADPKSDASLFMWRPGFEAPDAERYEFTGAWAGSNILKWAKRGTFGVINRFFHGDLWDVEPLEFMGFEALVAVLLDDDSFKSLKADLETQLIAMTKKYPQWASMVLKKSDLEPAVLQYFDKKSSPGPLISAVVFPGKHTGTYVLNGQAEVAKMDVVATFVADIKKGKSKHKAHKSEPVPAVPEDKAGLLTLVADSFDQYVLDPTKSVIVDFSEPSCEDCKKLDPIWKEVAKHMKKSAGSENVKVAKINVKANDVEKETFEKVPTIVFYPAVKSENKFKKRKVYTGKREFEAIVTFINDNLENAEDEL